MAKAIPRVDHDLLTQPEGAADPIVVGSAPWYAWLEHATSFAFRGAGGRFTAAKDRRSSARAYWKAYRRQAGVLQRAYLGPSAELTLERLNSIALVLERRGAGALPAVSVSVATPERPLRVDAPLRALAPPSDAARPLHLLHTKLTLPPLRANLVPRPHLVAQLDAAVSQRHKLILLSAPAGSGKTTLLAAWLGRAATPAVAWISLADNDDDLGQFLAYLIAALETVRPGIGAEAWMLLQAQVAHPPAHAILSSLVHALEATPAPVVLALDDYHTISLQVIHEAVAFLLDHMPAQMALVITTRADPPLPLARLRARGQFTEVRAANLRFTAAEALHLFDGVPGLNLSSAAITTLASRTEGWAAGLQLAALALQQNADQFETFVAEFSGNHRYVFDYLAEEVFQRQTPTVQTFLTQTAVLSRLCGPLCAAVTGYADASALIDHLDHANMFLIALDERRQWYRYHHLFADFLRERLDRRLGSAERMLLHRRASAWFEQNNLLCEAIDHALSAHAWDDALRCLAPLMANAQFYAYLLDWPCWLALLPDAALTTDGDLCLRFAWILALTGRADLAQRPLALAEAVWRAVGNETKLGETLCYRALAAFFTGDAPRMIQAAQHALALLPDDAGELRAVATFFLGRDQVRLGHMGAALEYLTAAHAGLKHSHEPLFARAAVVAIAQVFQFQGRLQQAATLYQDVIRRADAATQQPALYLFFGQLRYEWNDLDAAEDLLRDGLAVGRQTGRERYWPGIYSSLVRVCWARGDAAQASSIVVQALAAAHALASTPEISEAEAQQGWLWLAQGNLAAAERWLATRGLAPTDAICYERQAEYLMLARIRIAQERQTPGAGRLDVVVQMLGQLRHAAETDVRALDCITILNLIALAHAAQGDQQQARETLMLALARAAPERPIRTFVDEGMPLHWLIATCRRQGAPRLSDAVGTSMDLGYLDQLLAAFLPHGTTDEAHSGAVDLLSERERAVLALLASGCSMHEIAARLVISPHTVRTHVKNIYAKLDAHTRVEALTRARSLQLI